MHIEIQVALNFVISYLYNKLPRRRVNIFGEEVEKALKQKFQGHWYPEKPFKVSIDFLASISSTSHLVFPPTPARAYFFVLFSFSFYSFLLGWFNFFCFDCCWDDTHYYYFAEWFLSAIADAATTQSENVKSEKQEDIVCRWLVIISTRVSFCTHL